MSFKRQLTSALALSLFLKAFTFTLSTTLTRLLLPEQSGIGFTYAIYTDTALFIAREAVRSVAARQPLSLTASPPAGADAAGDDATAAAQLGAEVRAIAYISYLALPVGVIAMLVMEWQSVVGVSVFPCLLRDVYPTSLIGIDDMFPFLSPQAAVVWSTTFARWLSRLPHLFVWASVLMTLLVEPCLVLAQCLGSFSRVVVSEFVSLVVRLSVTIFFVWYSPLLDKWETQLFFAFGYVAASVAHLAFWVFTCRRSGRRAADAHTAHPHQASLQRAVDAAFLPPPSRHREQASPPTAAAHTARNRQRYKLPFPFYCLVVPALVRAARHHAALLITFGRESVLRLVLSQGETFTLTVFGSATARGHYELITHLGSLIARLVFRVWENACGVRWSQLVASGQGTKAVELLAVMLRLAMGVGLTFPLLGPPLAKHFLSVLYSVRWSSPPMVSALQWFCWTVPCMAVNGLLEAFLRATASPPALKRLQTCMVVESVMYMLLCYAVLGTSWWSALSVYWPWKGLDAVPHADSVVPLVCVNLLNTLARSTRSVMLILLESRVPVPAAGRVEGPKTPVTVPTSLFTQMVRPAFGLAVLVLFVLTRVCESVAVAVGAGCLYPVLLLVLDVEVRVMVTGLLRGATSLRAGEGTGGKSASAEQDVKRKRD